MHTLSLPMTHSSASDVYINSSPPEDRVFLRKSKAELEKLQEENPDSTDIEQKGLLDHYKERPIQLSHTCLADFAAYYTFHKIKEEPELDEYISANEDDVNSYEETNKMQKKFYLKDKSGYVTKRQKPRVIRFRKYYESLDKLNYYRENLMLFSPWHTEPLINEELISNFDSQIETIRCNREKYCKYDNTFENLVVDVLEEESDNEENEDTPEFAIFDLATDQSDFALEFNQTSSSTNNIDSTKFSVPKLISDEDFLSMMRNLNQKQRKYILNLVHMIKTKPKEQFFHFLSGGAGVGKTTTVNSLIQCLLRYWKHQFNNNPDGTMIIVSAPTGKAACNINGSTINACFQLGFNIVKTMKNLIS